MEYFILSKAMSPAAVALWGRLGVGETGLVPFPCVDGVYDRRRDAGNDFCVRPTSPHGRCCRLGPGTSQTFCLLVLRLYPKSRAGSPRSTVALYAAVWSMQSFVFVALRTGHPQKAAVDVLFLPCCPACRSRSRPENRICSVDLRRLLFWT